MNKPAVSILMNCFNGELFLKEAIQSVINQSFRDWELIFWDNRSNDKSAEIFHSFSDNRLKYYLSKMLYNFILYLSLIILGLLVMRFGIFQIRKFKKGETKVTKKISEQIAFVIFFIIIIGLIIYSVNDLLF